MTSTVQLAVGSNDNITTGNENKLRGGRVKYLCAWLCEKVYMEVFVCLYQVYTDKQH